MELSFYFYKKILFFCIICVSSLGFSQEFDVHNFGQLYVSSNTDVYTSGIMRNRRVSGVNGEITNYGNCYASSYRNDGDLFNDGFIKTTGNFNSNRNITNDTNGVIEVGNTYTVNRDQINNGVIDATRDYRHNGRANTTNNGVVYVGRDFRVNGTINLGTGKTVFDGTSTGRNQHIHVVTVDAIPDEVIFNNLEINTNSSIVIGGRIISNVLNELDPLGVFVFGDLDMVKGDIRLLGESQLIQDELSVLNYTSGELHRDQQGIASVYAYNYFSSPVRSGASSYSLSSVLFDGSDALVNPTSSQGVSFVSGSPFNGSPSILDGSGNVVTPLSLSDSWFYGYFQATGTYEEWIKLSSSSDLFVGQGITYKGTGTSDATQNYVFRGVPNNGLFNTDLQMLSGQESLLGNPYPSALDAKIFLDDNTFINQLELWVDGGSSSHYLSAYLGGYAIMTKTGGTPPSVIPNGIAGLGTAGSIADPKPYVAVAQAFMVKAVADGTVTFRNQQRVFIVESTGESNFYRGSKSFDMSLQSNVRIGYEDPEGFHRQLLLGFIPGSKADDSFNVGYDGYISETRADDIFFKIPNDPRKFVIQGVNSFDSKLQYPVSVKIDESGTHYFMLDALENFIGEVFLFDALQNKYYNLLEGEKTQLNFERGEYNDRFFIVFEDESSTVLGKENLELKNFELLKQDDVLHVKGDYLSNVVSLSIYDSSGKQIKLYGLDELQNKGFRVRLDAEGVFVVRLETQSGVLTKKIIN